MLLKLLCWLKRVACIIFVPLPGTVFSSGFNVHFCVHELGAAMFRDFGSCEGER